MALKLAQIIGGWLSDNTPDRATQLILDRSAVLGTDVGIQRQENQDRVSALRVPAASPNKKPFFCIAVSDGMGGMKNGAECATITIGSFFAALIQNLEHDSEQRLRAAAHSANKSVNEYARASGGATLSAVLVEANGTAYYVNVGDSRIYTSNKLGGKLARVTVDDNLKEAFGGIGRELVQFIGIGSGMIPRVGFLPKDTVSVFLTSDGAHFIDPSLMDEIVSNASDPIRGAERILALARWLGGPDNASISAFQLPILAGLLNDIPSPVATIWSATSQLEIAYVPEQPVATARPPVQIEEHIHDESPPSQPLSTKRKLKKGKKRDRSTQLEININSDEGGDGSNS